MTRRIEGRTSAPWKAALAVWAVAAASTSVAARAEAPPPADLPESRAQVEKETLTVARPVAIAPGSDGNAVANPEAEAAPLIIPDPADTRAATALLREAVVVRPGGRHHRLLRALRFLEDPGLAPFFRRLCENEHAALRVHGLLGTAELATPRGVTTENLVDLECDDQRAEVIIAALDGGLLNDRTLDELLAWPGLADEVKLLLATPRVAAGEVVAGSPAHAAMVAALGMPGHATTMAGGTVPTTSRGDDPNAVIRDPGDGANPFDVAERNTHLDRPVAPAVGLGRRGLAALLLHQMGDTRGTQGLIALNNANAPARDPVRATLLETARARGLDRAGTWAYSVASEPDLPPRLGDLALEVAAGFGDARAHRRWGERLRAAQDSLSRRTRLALAGLTFASAAEPEVFNLVAVDADPFVAAVGRTARAVAVASPAGVDAPGSDPPAALAALTTALNALHATDHPLAHAWLARFAADPATPDAVAQATARRLITDYRPGLATGRARRLQAVLDAVETLLHRDPAGATDELPRVLIGADADAAWTQAVLLGLIRSRTSASASIAHGVAVPTDPDAKALALVLRLRGGGLVGPQLRATLTRVLRGQTALDDELRVQAAWNYLKRTAETNAIAPLGDDADRDAVARTRDTP